jgi:cell filamentation protein
MQEYEYYYEGAEFYCYPQTDILINKFGFLYNEKIAEIERKYSNAKTQELEKHPIKGDNMFYRFHYIEQGMRDMHTKLVKEDYLKGLDKENFCKRLAYYMGELDAIHPFREGNGRTMRLYFKQLAIESGWRLEFHLITKEELLAADIAAFNTDYEPLIDVLNKIVSKLLPSTSD